MNKRLLGALLFIALIVLIIGIKIYDDNEVEITNAIDTIKEVGTIEVTIATGGGKEDFISDERVLEIMKTKYKVNPIYDTWSNGKLIKEPLVRKADGSKYDLMFCSDQRFYDYYKVAANKAKGEADRYQVLDGGLTVIVDEVRIFIPASLVSDTFEKDLTKYAGEEIEFAKPVIGTIDPAPANLPILL